MVQHQFAYSRSNRSYIPRSRDTHTSHHTSHTLQRSHGHAIVIPMIQAKLSQISGNAPA